MLYNIIADFLWRDFSAGRDTERALYSALGIFQVRELCDGIGLARPWIIM